MDRAITSRRALLRAASTAIAYTAGAGIVAGGIAMVPEAHGATTAATAATPFMRAYNHYRAACDRLNNYTGGDTAINDRLERELLDAIDKLDAIEPSNWHELTLALQQLAEWDDEDVGRLARAAAKLDRGEG